MKPITVLSASEQVAQQLRRAILRGEFGGTMPGTLPLTAEIGVNHKTVRAALKQLEQEGLLVPQGAGRSRKIVLPGDHAPPGLRVALLLFDAQARGEDFMIDLRHRLEVAGHLPFYADKSLDDLGRNVGRVNRYVAKTEADAWIIGAGSHDILRWFAEQKIPTFAMFGIRDRLPIAATGPDKGPTFAAATRRLLALGHRRISFIGRRQVRQPTPARGVRAVVDELKATGIPAGPFHLPDWNETREGFEQLLESLFGGPTPPTALILDEAFQFNSSYHHLSRRGLRVPQDVSLVCTDDDPSFVWCQPAVSHIRWDSGPVVRRIVRWANNVAQGKDDRRQTLTQAEFVEGGTIGPA